MAGKDPADLTRSLENLSIPELEALLQQDFLASDDGAADIDYIKAVVEVIQKKEAAQPDYQPVDVDKAWEDFRSIYNTEEGRRCPIYPSSLPRKLTDPDAAPKASKRRGTIRRTLLIAASLVLLVALTVVPVFGYPNVIQMVAHLANGTFRFVPDTSISGQHGDGSGLQPNGTYTTLPEALEAYGINEQVFPKVLAEEFEQVELKVEEQSLYQRIDFYARYENDAQTLMFTIVKYTDLDSQTYEVNEDLEYPSVYKVNGITHHILQNLDRTVITWYINDLECSLRGNFSIAEAESIIDSIY